MTTGARPDEASAPGAHMAALDGVRGLAIMMVLLVHFVGDDTPRSTVEHWVTRLANYGVWGVDLFFVLSGFLITGILYDSKTKPSYFRNFYVRRALRIFPLYYGVLLALFVLLPALPVPYPEGLSESLRNQGWLWSYASNVYVSMERTWSALPYVSHFWSLAVEEHFYLVWPVVVFAFAQRTLLKICVASVAFALCLRSALSFAGAGDVALVALTPCRLDALCVGAFLAVAVRAAGLPRLALLAKPSLMVLSALIVLATGWNSAVGALHAVVLPLRGTLVALAFGALLILSLVAPRTSGLGRLFHSPTLRFFGKYSYGLYVFHALIATAFQHRGVEAELTAALGSHAAAMLVQAVVGIGASLLVAVGSYELFEKHFLRLKGRFAPPDGERPAVILPHATRLV